MKVLMVNKFLYPNGGSETYVFKSGEELMKMGHEVQYFGMEHERRIVGNRAESYTSNMDFHTGKLQKLLYPFKIIYSMEARKKLRKVLEDFEPDAVHLNNFNFQLTPSVIYEIRAFDKKRKKKTALIYTAHDYQWVCPNHMLRIPANGKLCMRCVNGSYGNCAKYNCIHNSKIKSILGTIEGTLYKKLKTYRHIDKIVCPSEFMNRILSNNPLLKEKTVTLHNFIEKSSGIHINSDEKKDYILYFGRYAEEKGIRTLLEVCEELEELPFVFAGNGPLEEMVNKVKNIENKGFLSGEELKKIIREARFVLFPSEWYENCPFSVMESQMYGTPVLGADIGGTPELIKEYVTGELFESGNKEALKAAIKKLWDDRETCRKYAKGCRDITFDTTKEYCRKLVDIYRLN
ncbi:MAG: glycosyltransferase family 4 protein [Clostridiales bacterium]|nr:glycosyltransferase family 4 protein [Clostridiales bacterium]